MRVCHDFVLAVADVSQKIQGICGLPARVVRSPLGEREPQPKAVPDGFARVPYRGEGERNPILGNRRISRVSHLHTAGGR
jgi:hypothetical protein